MAKPIDAILTQWVTPVLKPLGFRKTRRTYRYRDERGNQSYLHVQGSMGSTAEQYQFFLEIGIAPRALMDFQRYAFGDRASDPAPGMDGWTRRVHAPEPVEYGSPHSGIVVSELWTVDADDSEQQQLCGRLLSRAAQQWGPKLVHLTDPLTLLAHLESAEEDDHSEPSLIGAVDAPRDIYLLIDEGPSPTLDQAIATAADSPAGQVAEWARIRLADPDSPGR